MKKYKYIIFGVIIFAIGTVIYLKFNPKNTVTCFIEPYIDPGDPKKVTLTGVIKKNKIASINAKYIYDTKNDADNYCDYYKETQKKVKCSKNSVSITNVKDISMFGDDDVIGKSEDDFKTILTSYGYTCK